MSESLSDKRLHSWDGVAEDGIYESGFTCYDEEDVREAVKKLKDKLCPFLVKCGDSLEKGKIIKRCKGNCRPCAEIDKIFGSKLI
jgi:hypothetical protein